MDFLPVTGSFRSAKVVTWSFSLLTRQELLQPISFLYPTYTVKVFGEQKIRGEVQMELAIYLMSLGDYASYEAAYNEIRPYASQPISETQKSQFNLRRRTEVSFVLVSQS